ncbi:M15 family metallopeptidase [Fictibacillus sp. Mic-4]|uniref:M15 family metallopeptidase n=1 Tax=Fictibacillus TaxID=1329200 RepID=UPI000422B861|nr:M15 family metallopeptidase [Fictibacillus gelatini]
MMKITTCAILLSSIVTLSGCSITNGFDKEKNENHAQHTAQKHTKNNKSDNRSTSNTQGEKPSIKGTTKVGPDGKTIVTNPDDILVVANKKRNLPSDYAPKDLVIPKIPWPFKENIEKKHLRKEAAAAVEKLFHKAKADGMDLYGQSGYRSYARQVSIFAFNSKQKGEEKANQVSAIPGQSEHQTGLALDVTCPEVNFDLNEQFGETKEGKWLKQNAADFGFIIRYPKGKEKITGYQYEPWHIRYVGVKVAKEIAAKNETLEEYFGLN